MVMDSWASAFHPARLLLELRAFLEQGGVVLVVIMLTTFALWLLIVERHYYFWMVQSRLLKKVVDIWDKRRDKHSWYAQKERLRLLSVVRIKAEHNLSTIKSVVMVAPLLGLLGTVVGMIDVFDVMAFTGSSNSRAMAAGISKATIPTMAGMVVSLSGLLFSVTLQRRAKQGLDALSGRLVTMHDAGEPT
jgi:biopolymer transport protein ExbB